MGNDQAVDLNATRSDAWADSFIVRLEQIVLNEGGQIKWIDQVTGSPVTVAITPVLVAFIKENKAALLAVGREDFKGFLELLQKDQTVDALEAVYAKIDTDALLSQYDANSTEFKTLAEQAEAQRKFWVSLAEQLAIKLAPAAIGLLL